MQEIHQNTSSCLLRLCGSIYTLKDQRYGCHCVGHTKSQQEVNHQGKLVLITDEKDNS